MQNCLYIPMLNQKRRKQLSFFRVCLWKALLIKVNIGLFKVFFCSAKTTIFEVLMKNEGLKVLYDITEAIFLLMSFLTLIFSAIQEWENINYSNLSFKRWEPIYRHSNWIKSSSVSQIRHYVYLMMLFCLNVSYFRHFNVTWSMLHWKTFDNSI